MPQISISEQNITEYLRSKDVIADEADTEVVSLGGGVSNTVLRVSTPNVCYVVKQPLPNLAVDDDWPADTTRVHNEAAATTAYRQIISTGGLTDIKVPDLRFEDTSNHVIAITCAPTQSKMWKSELLDGHVDPRIGAILGRFLTTSHNTASKNPKIRSKFANKTPFDSIPIIVRSPNGIQISGRMSRQKLSELKASRRHSSTVISAQRTYSLAPGVPNRCGSSTSKLRTGATRRSTRRSC